MTLNRKKRCRFCKKKGFYRIINNHVEDIEDVERFESAQFKKSEMMKRKVNNDLKRQHLSPKTQVGLRSEVDWMVHYGELRMLGHQSRVVKGMVNGFVSGTVVDVPFAQGTIRDIIEFVFYHHYVHPVLEEVCFDREFAKKRVNPMDKFELACAGVYLGIDSLMQAFVINIVEKYDSQFTFRQFSDYTRRFIGGNLREDQEIVLRLLDGVWGFS